MTGVSRETIRFYISEGLLPPPAKSAHNMGWYSQRHVELLKLIQQLRNEQFLPLKAIRTLVHGSQEFEFSEPQARVLAQLREKLRVEDPKLLASVTPGSIGLELGLSRQEQKELKQLSGAADDSTTASDVELSRLWIQLRENGINAERGFSPKDLFYLRDLVDNAVSEELHLFEHRIRSMSPDEASRLRNVVVPALSRIFMLLHERRLALFIERFLSRAQARATASPRKPRGKPVARAPKR